MSHFCTTLALKQYGCLSPTEQMENDPSPSLPAPPHLQLQLGWLEEVWFLPKLWAWHSPSHKESTTPLQKQSCSLSPAPKSTMLQCVLCFDSPPWAVSQRARALPTPKHPQLPLLTEKNIDLPCPEQAHVCGEEGENGAVSWYYSQLFPMGP
jgi:hypothetical protein